VTLKYCVKNSPHQMTVRVNATPIQKVSNLYQTQPIKVDGYGLVADNDDPFNQTKRISIHANGKPNLFKIRNTKENATNDRIQFGS
jgi:hypothetical protein